LAQFGEIGVCLFAAADIRFCYNLDQGYSRPVEIDGGIAGLQVMQAFAGIFFQVNAVEPDIP